MAKLTFDLEEADTVAVANTDFCKLWPPARQALELLAGVISNIIVKAAIKTVIAAGNAYCGASKNASTAGKASSYLSGDLTGGDDCICLAFTAVSSLGVDKVAAAPSADSVDCICAGFTAVRTIGAEGVVKAAGTGSDPCVCIGFSLVNTVGAAQAASLRPQVPESAADCICAGFSLVTTLGADQLKAAPQQASPDCICLLHTVVSTLGDEKASVQGKCICAVFTAVNTLGN